MRIIFTGGGTGGHIYPAVAVAGKISDKLPDVKILFLVGIREMERRIVNDTGFAVKTIPVTGLPRKLTLAFIPFMWKLGISIIKSMNVIRVFKPSVILATGGYVSGPPVLAGWTMGVPVVIQEQNYYPGITTKKLARFAEIVILGFQDAAEFFGERVTTVFTGNPVRENIGLVNREASFVEFGLEPRLKTVLVFGGSQGAMAINSALSEIVEDLAEHEIQVIWQTGFKEFEKWSKFNSSSGGRIKVVPYLNNMDKAYSASDLVVSRAGAMTVAEITACGLPGIFIPLPTAAENHQEYNARSLVKFGAASLILESDLTPEKLKQEIIGIATSDEKLNVMSRESRKLGKKDAASVIADIVIEKFGMN